MELLKPELVCAIVVAYKPDLVRLRQIIASLKEQLVEIILVDNCSDSSVQFFLLEESKNIGFELIQNNKNYGIAKALNQGVLVAKDKGFRWAFTFDQDSKLMNQMVMQSLNVFNSLEQQHEIGAIGINALKSSNDLYYPFQSDYSYKERDYLITSGTLISLDVFEKIGGFREDFFIDNVDLEYSLRLKLHGYKSFITKEPGMFHDPGNPVIKKIFGIKIKSSNHSSFRRYFMARNHVILSKLYFFRFPYFILKSNYFFILSVFYFVMVESNRYEKIKMTFKGLKDGIFN